MLLEMENKCSVKSLSLYFIGTLHGKRSIQILKQITDLLFLIIVLLSHSFKDLHNLEWNIYRDFQTKSPP